MQASSLSELCLRFTAAAALLVAVFCSPIRATNSAEGARYPNHLRRNFSTCPKSSKSSFTLSSPTAPARPKATLEKDEEEPIGSAHFATVAEISSPPSSPRGALARGPLPAGTSRPMVPLRC